MNMKTKMKKTLAAIVFCSFTFIAQAQGPGDPGGDPGGGGDPGNTNVPIDGGLTLLIAAGVGFAAKKGYDKRKKDNEAKIQG